MIRQRNDDRPGRGGWQYNAMMTEQRGDERAEGEWGGGQWQSRTVRTGTQIEVTLAEQGGDDKLIS